MTHSDLSMLKGFANNSTVGASKVLHFLNPKVYSIWDSRVARQFLWKGVTRPTFDQDERLLEYFDTLWDWRSDPRIRSRCQELRRARPELGRASTMRLLELVMFHAK